MKAVILAGGLGTRLGEETQLRPKPMIEIGGRPLLWHIMKIYERGGITDFVVCLGYRGYVIKEYFANYALHASDATFDLGTNTVRLHQSSPEAWRVTLIDTGGETMTGGRLKRALPHVSDEDFCFTYGDGVADIDVRRLVAFHRERGTVATLTAVQPPGRFGALRLRGTSVQAFVEKPQGDGGWINGGFFVLSPRVGAYLADDSTEWERAPLEKLAAEGQLSAYQHDGFWHAVDTLRDKNQLEALVLAGHAAWLR